MNHGRDDKKDARADRHGIARDFLGRRRHDTEQGDARPQDGINDYSVLENLIRAEFAELRRMVAELQRQLYEQEEFLKANGQARPTWNDKVQPESSELTGRAERSNPDLDLLAFLEEANRRSFTLDEVRQWLQARSHDGIVEDVNPGPGGWTLLRIVRGDTASIVPTIRRPMAGVPLSEYFVVTNYNGLEPLKPQHVVRFPTQQRHGEIWRTTVKGELNGGLG